MDSGSTGSMQSSSGGGGGGEEEYESRAAAAAAAAAVAESIPSFLINNPPGHFLQISNPHPPPFFFDPPPSNCIHTFNSTPTSSQSLNSLLCHHNQDSLWSRSSLPRTDPHPTELAHLVVSSSSSSANSHSLLGTFSNTSSAPLPPLLHDGNNNNNNIDAIRTSSSAHPSDQFNMIPPRSTSKKRTRASRRAPTTVLTTDTSNFRAMVQEFTGIPAPPFSAGAAPSLYSSRRLDLFSTAGSAMRSTHSSSESLQLPPLGPAFPLRPSAQKVNQPSPPPPPPPSLILKPSPTGFVDDASNNASGSGKVGNGGTHAMSSVMNYQNIPINMQNDNPGTPKFNSLFADNAPFFSSKAHQGMSEEQLEVVHTAELNMSGFPIHDSSSDRSLQLRGINPNNHSNGNGSGNADNNNNNNNNIDLITSWRVDGNTGNGQDRLTRSFNFNDFNGSCKLNSSTSCSASSSSFSVFQSEKGPPENVISRPEGTVDSWICNPSD